jgi:hypothetical protein
MQPVSKALRDSLANHVHKLSIYQNPAAPVETRMPRHQHCLRPPRHQRHYLARRRMTRISYNRFTRVATHSRHYILSISMTCSPSSRTPPQICVKHAATVWPPSKLALTASIKKDGVQMQTQSRNVTRNLTHPLPSCQPRWRHSKRRIAKG